MTNLEESSHIIILSGTSLLFWVSALLGKMVLSKLLWWEDEISRAQFNCEKKNNF